MVKPCPDLSCAALFGACASNIRWLCPVELIGGGVATDSVFQLNNLNVGGEVGSVESGVLAIFAAEDVFQPTNPTSLSCTSGSNGISVIVFLENKHTIFLNVRRIIFLCY